MVLCLGLRSAGPAWAAGGGRWADPVLHLALTYPAGWTSVPEHGAALKLRAADGKGEFEVFRVAPSQAAGDPAARVAAALAKAHCSGGSRTAVVAIVRLGVHGSQAGGLCSGADLGWRLTATVFRYRGTTVLLRSWLYRAQPRDRADLAAIAASLA